MENIIKKIINMSVIAVIAPGIAFGAQAPNPRGGATSNARNVVSNADGESNAAIRRSATSVIARTAAGLNKRATRTVAARPANVSAPIVSRAASTTRVSRAAKDVISNTVNVSRAATSGKAGLARSGVNKAIKMVPTSRANKARATAVFGDISKIGGGYAGCRDSYATCMDQFCAGANETYRRCFCSERFTDFQETADALDTALKMLADFQDNNLNAVDKTAAEVSAMYTASAGEAAIKRDTSASQQLLDSIGDVLSGKKKTEKKKDNKSGNGLNSLGTLDLSGFSSSVGDVWGGGGDDIFGGGNNKRGSGSYTDMSELEGKELYEASVNQCAEITRDACTSDALFNMARSAYTIMITQDCNMYEKNINAKKEQVQETVRTAEKYLREARLEEYRAHNSSDVNECITNVETAMRQPTACGPKYEKCLDYTGQYVNTTTGEPIYSQALFGLNNLIVLGNTADVLAKNKKFDEFLESRKMFAEKALDSCRGIADNVWPEYKRQALIQIAQAQDEKIEEVKASCVTTMKDCYDTQSGSLNELAGDDIQTSTGAISAVAAHDMCHDKVLACAALYGDPDGCKYDDKSKKISTNPGKTCGLTSLLAFVNTVDSVKVAKGCEESLREYAQDICKGDGTEGGYEYPWGCRTRWIGEPGDFTKKASVTNETTGDKSVNYANNSEATLYAMFEERAKYFCADQLIKDTAGDRGVTTDGGLVTGITDSTKAVATIIAEIKEGLEALLSEKCDELGGFWIANDGDTNWLKGTTVENKMLAKYYTDVLGGRKPTGNQTVGACYENTGKLQCDAQAGDKEDSEGNKKSYWNESTLTCDLPDEWYENKCKSIGGYYKTPVCYVKK